MSENQKTESPETVGEEQPATDLVIQYMNLEEFIKLGFLQEANRLFFHPLGLALEIRVDEDGVHSLGGVWDFRNDPEGMAFGMELDPVKAANVEAERLRHVETRQKNLGYEIQPIDDKPGERATEPTPEEKA